MYYVVGCIFAAFAATIVFEYLRDEVSEEDKEYYLSLILVNFWRLKMMKMFNGNK